MCYVQRERVGHGTFELQELYEILVGWVGMTEHVNSRKAVREHGPDEEQHYTWTHRTYSFHASNKHQTFAWKAGIFSFRREHRPLLPVPLDHCAEHHTISPLWGFLDDPRWAN